MGCQLDITEQIIEQEANYVIGLKGNQGLLRKDIKEYFKTARDTQFKDITHGYHEEVDKKHGRHETRKYWIVNAPSTLHRADKWKRLQTIGMVKRKSTIGNKTTIDIRYLSLLFKQMPRCLQGLFVVIGGLKINYIGV